MAHAGDDSVETRLTLLGSERDVDDGELGRLYAYPEQPAVWVRANFISSVDGAATLDGRSGGLAGPGDRTVFGLLRALADVIVVGAGTARTEKYAGAHLNVGQRLSRQGRGQTEVPGLALVTNSGRLDRNMAVFRETEVAPLVLTCTTSVAPTRDRLAGVLGADDVVDCSSTDPDRVDLAAALAVLGARGHRRVLTEGGPTLLGSLVERGLLDELCLTVAPYLVAGRAPRIAATSGQAQTSMRCAHLLSDQAGYFYTRYVRTEPAAVE